MTVIRDRRNEPINDKFGTDIERFRMRYMKRIKQAIQDSITDGDLENLGKGGIKVPIPKETTKEPFLHHEGTGDFSRIFPGNNSLASAQDLKAKMVPSVFPGNMALDVGDVVPIPKGGGGGGGGPEGSDEDMDAQDDFIWVNEADLLHILFEGRQLPDMTKLKASHVHITETEHSGYTNKGPDHRMDMERTNRKRREESLVLGKSAERRVFENLTEQFNILSEYAESPALEAIEIKGKNKQERNNIVLDAAKKVVEIGDDEEIKNAAQILSVFQETVEVLNDRFADQANEDHAHRLSVLEDRLEEQLKGKQKKDRFREEHLTYEYDDDIPKPNAKAVMFCQMDVSASMGQEEKNTAKVFFWLLKRFLDEKYDEVDIVFIAHTTEAHEVDEDTFFYGTETGGTLVSSCLEKTLEIIEDRYPVGDWNIYSAQASDGDNFSSDNQNLIAKMQELLPIIQAHYYVEVSHPHGWGRPGPSEMHNIYDSMAEESGGKIYTEWGLKSAVHALEAFKKFFPIGGKPEAANNNNPSPS